MATELPSCQVHTKAVGSIASRVRGFHNTSSPFRIYHGSTNSTRKSPRRHDNIVDISHLNRVLAIDVLKKIAFVEPNVPMDQLAAATLKMGLVPPVVMEFPGITAGGGFAGTSGESSSFKHGLFDRTVQAVEIVLGNGEVTMASPDDPETAELFHAAAASFGTLGVVTLLALELIDAQPFVELTYVRVASVDDAIGCFKAHTGIGTLDYMDGILFAKDRGVVCLGRMAEDNGQYNGKYRTFSQPRDDWFYINAQNLLLDKTQNSWTELVPLQEYLFRYERGAFWISKYTFKDFAVPLNRLTRWLLDTYTHTRIMYSALHHSGLSSQYIIQDVAIPYDNAAAFVSHLDTTFKNYPLWLCPLRMRGKSPTSAYGLLAEAPTEEADDHNVASAPRPEMMLNFGVWGPLGSNNDFTTWNRGFEGKINALGGQKWLYSHTFYTEEEFWSIHGDRKQYEKTRAKYHASSLPSIYEKVRATEAVHKHDAEQSWRQWLFLIFWSIWPFKGLYGWLLCILSEDYLLPRKASFWNPHQQAEQGEKEHLLPAEDK
ncbi:Delta(24)-sterol reductase [Fulvia fulva]|nr:Delta(24)-sterol reductase [Fulvia fulva]